MELQLTTKAQEAFSDAVRAAAAAGNPHVEPAHLLEALAQQADTTTPALLAAIGSSTSEASERAAKALAELPAASGSSVAPPSTSRAMLAAMERAQQAMASMGDTFISTDHLLLALAPDFGYDAGGWRVEQHPRFVVDITGDRRAEIVGFGNAGVWMAMCSRSVPFIPTLDIV